MKKCIAILLLAATILTLTSTALAATPTFPDITDAKTADNVAVLQMLGVINGDNGNFRPEGTLTRAEFCKMAIVIMGGAAQEPLYRNRTIFPDVRGGHWARGYINMAVAGERKIIAGNPDGTFKPDDIITFAQAVTILLRVIGYTDADVGYLWPQGYIDLSASVGLTGDIDRLYTIPDAEISRANAAQLFVNLLNVPAKGGEPFINTLGSATPDVLILELDAKTASGVQDALKTSHGTFKPAGDVVPQVFTGRRGALITNNNGHVLTFIPSYGTSFTVGVATVGATWLTDTDGNRYDVPADTIVYTSDGTTTFAEIYIDVAPGAAVTVYLDKTNAVDALLLNTAPITEAVVVTAKRATIATFQAMTGGDEYKIYKYGVKIPISEVAQYDVATFDSTSRALYISDFRLTGYYENAWPNAENPSKVTILGREFPVLPSAAQSFADVQLGTMITLLFTLDNQVAAAVPAESVWTNAIGVVTSASASSATVRLLNGMEFSGNPELYDYEASQLPGELATVVSTKKGNLTIARLRKMDNVGDFDIAAGTVGEARLAPGVQVFDRVGRGYVAQVSLSDITQAVIPSARVFYAANDTLGRVKTLILDDATGDTYIYGYLKEGWVDAPTLGSETPRQNNIVTVTNGGGEHGPYLTAGFDFKSGAVGGVAYTTDGARAAGIVMLTEVRGVSRNLFVTTGDKTTVKVDGMVFPVAPNVQCYNATTKTWFASLKDARLFAEKLTVYYDRAPEDGGKIRFLVAE
ncbi:MAG: S-layer homology domain-containing protein [Oscillospiraceae bacterium]|nr:S-layer homology domain-containing protein [Oscillospiraceae bacterium]